MNNEFKLIKEYNGENISHMKIYKDKEGIYRLKKICPICKEKVACFCFDGIEVAIEDFEFNEKLYCDRDYLKELWIEQCFWSIIDEECESNLTEMYSKIIKAKMSKCVKSKKYVDGIIKEGREIIDGFSDEQIKNILNKIDIDYEFNGKVCEI